jgi:prevent-host-death family protein
MWSVADAKAQLSEILRQARSGSPQVIGTQDPCVVVSLETYQNAIADADHDGQWLIALTARLGFDVPLPSRNEDRPDPGLDG